MAPENQTSKKSLWTGSVITALAVLLLFLDAAMKVMKVAVVMEASKQLGFSANQIVGIGVTLFACTVLYAIPRTSVLGAILLTGYLGGAVVTNLRAGSPMFSAVLFPVYFGVFVWAGIYLRDARLREMIPLRNKS
jgi:DoxX-like family